MLRSDIDAMVKEKAGMEWKALEMIAKQTASECKHKELTSSITR